MSFQNIAFISILILLSCTETTVDPDVDVVVVEAFLYEGEPVDDIQPSKLLPFGTEDTEPEYINDAMVTISDDTGDFLLIPSEGDSGYYHYPGSDLLVSVGVTYVLSFEHGGELISATTTVPQRPEGVTISHEEIALAPILEFEDLAERAELEDVEVIWENGDQSFYYVREENIEENPEEVNQLVREFGFSVRNFVAISEPVQLNFHVVRPFSLEQYGTYRITVYRVNDEYADLFGSFEQDSRSLNEPLNNIENGLRVFTSFSSEVLFLEVSKP